MSDNDGEESLKVMYRTGDNQGRALLCADGESRKLVKGILFNSVRFLAESGPHGIGCALLVPPKPVPHTGLIWGGPLRARSTPFRGSSSVPSSPTRTRTKTRQQAASSASVGEAFKRSGFSVSSKSPARPPSPERCRQIEADTARYRVA